MQIIFYDRFKSKAKLSSTICLNPALFQSLFSIFLRYLLIIFTFIYSMVSHNGIEPFALGLKALAEKPLHETKQIWLLGQVSNLQTFRRLINSQVRLPIPPPRNNYLIFSVQTLPTMIICTVILVWSIIIPPIFGITTTT